MNNNNNNQSNSYWIPRQYFKTNVTTARTIWAQVLAIPKADIEARHEYMLSVIKDRVDKADIYEREYFSKYPNYGYSRRKMGFNIDDLWEPKKKYFSRQEKDYEQLHQVQS